MDGTCGQNSVLDLRGREDEVIAEVAEILFQISSLPPRSKTSTSFDSSGIPPISMRDYVKRLWQYMDCSIECYVLAVAYVERILWKNPDFRVGMLNIHTLTLSAVVIAAKFHDDQYRSQAYYAKVGGVSVTSLYALECKFIKLLDWQAGVSPEDFQICLELLFCKDRMRRLRTRYVDMPCLEPSPKQIADEDTSEASTTDTDSVASTDSPTTAETPSAETSFAEDATSPLRTFASTKMAWVASAEGTRGLAGGPAMPGNCHSN